MNNPCRVLYLSDSGLPTAVGGRDVFMHELARAIHQRGMQVLCAYHKSPNDQSASRYTYDEVSYACMPPIAWEGDRRQYFNRTAPATPGFQELLDEFKPNIIHLHDFGYSCGLSHLRVAAAQQIATAMTFHSPGQSCLQKALRFRGQTACDGVLQYGRCSECRLSNQGVPIAIAKVLARMPLSILGVDYTSSGMRLLTSSNATKIGIDAWFEMVELLDLMHTHAQWVYDMVQQNGVPESKLKLYRTGLPRVANRVDRLPDSAGRLRVSFLGRCDPVKGINVLIDAVKLLPSDAPITVAFYGPYWSDAYGKSMLDKMVDDSRFASPELVPPTELDRVWRQTDVLVVPSLCPETGPLVVLEAFAAKVPVVGSNLGGIPELVRDGVDGFLFPAGDSVALSKQLLRLIADRTLLARLAANIRVPRTLADLADDLMPEYERLRRSRRACT